MKPPIIGRPSERESPAEDATLRPGATLLDQPELDQLYDPTIHGMQGFAELCLAVHDTYNPWR